MRTPLLIVAALLAGVALAAVLREPRPAEPSPAFRLGVLPESTPAPNFTLVDSTGRARTLSEQRGKVVVMFFGFTRCPDVCPTELYKLAQVMKALGDDSGRVTVTFITLDPERDTPQRLDRYVSSFDARFLGLSGTREQIDAAAASYYVAHARVGDDEHYLIDHSTTTYVIDPAGRLRLLAKMDSSIEALTHDIRLLLQQAS